MNKADKEGARRAARLIFNAIGMDNRNPDLLIIDRKFWGRGGEVGSLLTEAENGGISLCCLGILCIQRGLRPIQIHECGTPSGVRKNAKGHAPERLPKTLDAFVERNRFGGLVDTKLTDALVDVNDTRVGHKLAAHVFKLLKGNKPKTRVLKSEAQRENLIRRLFALAGIKVEFEN